MLEGAVRIGMYGDGFNTELAAGAQDTQGDFAAIGYENFLNHKF
jgi:hypothetical protein